MELIDLLPLEPPAELMEKVRQHKAMHQGWLVYKCAWIDDLPGISKMRVAQVHCTECNSTYNLEWTSSEGCRGKVYGFVEPRGGSAVWSRSNCLCPQCGADCRAMHVSEFGGVSVATMAWLTSMSFHRVGTEFAVCTWHTERHVDKEGRTSFETWPNEAYYTDGKALRKAVGYMKFMYSTFRIKHWEERVRCSDTLDSVDMWILPTESDLAGTMLENAKVIEYIRDAGTGRLIGYLKLYQKHKRVENLITAGLARLVCDEIYWCDDGLIDWKKKRPGEMLGMTRGELRYFSQKIPSNQYREGLRIWRAAKLLMRRLRIEELPLWLNGGGFYCFDSLNKLDAEPLVSLRYLEKQRKKYADVTISTGHLADYWRFCRELGEDLNNPEIRWPQNLVASHDMLSEQIAQKEDQLEQAAFGERLKALQVFTWKDEGLLIRPAKTRTELRNEGKALHHCVATYAKKHASGATAIFFIRRVEHPKLPFFTLELDETTLTVRQNRGLRNCSRTPEVVAFEARWLEHIKKMKEKEKKHGRKSIGA